MSITALSFQTFNVLSSINTKDTYGTPVINFTTVLSGVVGRQNYLNGQEFLQDGKISVIPTHKIFFETLLPINESYLILDNNTGNKFDIVHINSLGEYAGVHHLELLCKKVDDYNLN
jgi:hypothetical protein